MTKFSESAFAQTTSGTVPFLEVMSVQLYYHDSLLNVWQYQLPDASSPFFCSQ